MTTNEVVPANAALFADLCSVLQTLYKKKHHKIEQERILTNYINEFRINVGNVQGPKNSSFFPILRLLLPDKERERSAYNLKASKLAVLLIKVLSLGKNSQDAQRLSQYRSVNDSKDKDFAGVAYFVLRDRVGKNSGKLTVGDINDLLDRISAAEVGNKGPHLDEAMSYAINNLTAEQMKWFLRIILKDLKLGMGHNKILGAFHPDAPELYENCGNLTKVCSELDEGNTRPSELGIQVFFAVSPMLSERLDVTHLSRLPQNKTYHIEPKFDGERFQMHMENGVFEYYSRKGFAYGDTYGKTYDSGLLTPLLKDRFSASVTSLVLDGEMMGWHKHFQCFGSKGMGFDIKKIKDKSTYRPCFCVFDVLYYNGKTLVGPSDKGGMPLNERLKLLDSMFTDVPGVIQHSKRQIVQDIGSDVLEAMNKAIEDQDEGIVVKDTCSYYLANKRNAGWYKIKPEYTESTMTDLDLVIIGADEAENKRQGRAKSFHVACADVVAPGAPPHRWVCIGRVATGLSYEERDKLCIALERHWVPSKRTPPPQCLVFNKKLPDFWLMPEHSTVFQVRATELVRCADFGARYTLRFPRVVALRDDKPVRDVMTLDEFNQLVADKGSVVKLSSKRINEDQIDNAEAKVTRKRTKKAPLQVADQFRVKEIGEVEVTSNALLGRKICILSDDEDCDTTELIRIVMSHGGKHVENYGADTWCCVAGKLTPRVKNYIDSQELDILTTSWLRSLPQSVTPCALSPLDMLALKKSTKINLSADFDRFGDSYREMVDEETLKKCFKKMESEEPDVYLMDEEMLNLDQELFEKNNPFSYLRPCFIHITQNNSNNKIRTIKARMFGANVCDIQSPNLTHVVTSVSIGKDEVEALKRTKAFIVSEDWLDACFEEKKLVTETDFSLGDMF